MANRDTTKAILKALRPGRNVTSNVIRRVVEGQTSTGDSTYYHLKKLIEEGVLIPKGTYKPSIGKKGRGRPPKLFYVDPDGLKAMKQKLVNDTKKASNKEAPA